jgi:hypothetical protein
MNRVYERTGLPRSDVPQVIAETPTSLTVRSPSNLGGSCHGGEFDTADGKVIPCWPDHASSIPGLHVTGSTAHPGGARGGCVKTLDAGRSPSAKLSADEPGVDRSTSGRNPPMERLAVGAALLRGLKGEVPAHLHHTHGQAQLQELLVVACPP